MSSRWLGRHGTDAGLLLLRVCAGGMMLLSHGMPKLLGFTERMNGFPDPIGLGSTGSLVAAIFAEAVCAAAVVVGLGTRVAAVPLVFTMLVAAFVIHGNDPFMKKEFALIYAVVFGALILMGSGRFRLRLGFLNKLERWS